MAEERLENDPEGTSVVPPLHLPPGRWAFSLRPQGLKGQVKSDASRLALVTDAVACHSSPSVEADVITPFKYKGGT